MIKLIGKNLIKQISLKSGFKHDNWCRTSKVSYNFGAVELSKQDLIRFLAMTEEFRAGFGISKISVSY